jgi:hypothetical protein
MSHKLITTSTETYSTLAQLEDAIKNGNGPMTFDQRTELLANNTLTVNPDETTEIVITIEKGTDDVAAAEQPLTAPDVENVAEDTADGTQNTAPADQTTNTQSADVTHAQADVATPTPADTQSA